MGHLFILFILLLFIFDKATGPTTENLALILFETCEEFSSPGSRVVFNPKIFPSPYLHLILCLTRAPVYWLTPPAINQITDTSLL